MSRPIEDICGKDADECLELITRAVINGQMRLAERRVQGLTQHHQVSTGNARKHLIGKKGRVAKRIRDEADELRKSGRSEAADALAARLTRLARNVHSSQPSGA
jgi:hypothetical protein